MTGKLVFYVGPLGIVTARYARGVRHLKSYRYTDNRARRLWEIAQDYEHCTRENGRFFFGRDLDK
jgi:hypothetical protein